MLAVPLRAAASLLFFMISARPPPAPEFATPSERAVLSGTSDDPFSCLSSTSYVSYSIKEVIGSVPIERFFQVAS